MGTFLGGPFGKLRADRPLVGRDEPGKARSPIPYYHPIISLMPNSKKNRNQSFFGEVAKHPKGMPPIDVVRSEVIRMGLPKTDADHMYDVWLANGFRTKVGPIKDWKAVLRLYRRNNWLPSLRDSKTQSEETETRVLRQIQEIKQAHSDARYLL
jgi:hypothetical protein